MFFQACCVTALSLYIRLLRLLFVDLFLSFQVIFLMESLYSIYKKLLVVLQFGEKTPYERLPITWLYFLRRQWSCPDFIRVYGIIQISFLKVPRETGWDDPMFWFSQTHAPFLGTSRIHSCHPYSWFLCTQGRAFLQIPESKMHWTLVSILQRVGLGVRRWCQHGPMVFRY